MEKEGEFIPEQYKPTASHVLPHSVSMSIKMSSEISKKVLNSVKQVFDVAKVEGHVFKWIILQASACRNV